MTISNNVQTSYVQSTNSSNIKKVSNSQEDLTDKYEFKNIPKKTLDTIYDDTNTFGMFLNKNEKAMQLLDEQLGNMDESERSKFLFVMGHVGDEHVLRAAFQRGISPEEAIPYVTNIAQTFKNDTVFAESLYKMVDNKEETSTEIGKLVEKFYEKYTNTFNPIDLKA